MKKIKIWLYLLAGIVGAISFYVGEFILVGDEVKNFSGLCIGLGAAIFSLGIGQFIYELFVPKSKNAELLRKKNIEVKDERNIRLREKVGAKIIPIVNYALSAIILILGFMQIGIVPILMLVSVFIIELVMAITLTDYYSKRM